MSKIRVAPKADRTYDGIVFHSKTEAERYLELKMLERFNDIGHLELQPQFKVEINDRHFCTYTADFRYYDFTREEWVIEDVKSTYTDKDPAFRLRRKAAELYHDVTIHSVIGGKRLTKKKEKGKKKKVSGPDEYLDR